MSLLNCLQVAMARTLKGRSGTMTIDFYFFFPCSKQQITPEKLFLEGLAWIVIFIHINEERWFKRRLFFKLQNELLLHGTTVFCICDNFPWHQISISICCNNLVNSKFWSVMALRVPERIFETDFFWAHQFFGKCTFFLWPIKACTLHNL